MPAVAPRTSGTIYFPRAPGPSSSSIKTNLYIGLVPTLPAIKGNDTKITNKKQSAHHDTNYRCKKIRITDSLEHQDDNLVSIITSV